MLNEIKSRLSRIHRGFLSGKITKILTIICLSAFVLQAQDITNKLGGNTANETYDVTDSNDNLLFRVQGDKGALFTGTFGTGTIPATGAGTRLMWYAAKAAFRVGYVGGTQWDDANIGDYSIGLGRKTTARGYASIALGDSTTASGIASFATGFITEASGIYSTALGGSTTASGAISTAMGSGSIASGDFSTAAGDGVLASGGSSTAMGFTTEASGDYSTAMGDVTIASGSSSTAIGVSTVASGIGSTAMGNMTKASGLVSTAMGWSTTASGESSTAMGLSTTASGHYSTAMGGGTTASGYNSTAMGDNTEASGISSTAMGTYTTASGDRSTAIGRGIEASGGYTVAIALNDQSGTIVTQNNTMAIMGGKVGIGTIAPEANLDIHGTVKAFGDWVQTYSTENAYQAPTDGFVHAWIQSNGGTAAIFGYSDSNSNPTELRAAAVDIENGSAITQSIIMAVRKDDYWTVSDGFSGGYTAQSQINWIPLGQ